LLARSTACGTTATRDHGTDHGANVSIYLADPDGNGIELYYDRRRADWFDADGHPILKAEPFDPDDLLRAA
jgi:catechol 2,3-dioxygenase